MDVLGALILACSVHYDDNLVEALAMKMSLGNQYFVGDLTTLNTYDTAHSVAEAHKIVDAIIAKRSPCRRLHARPGFLGRALRSYHR